MRATCLVLTMAAAALTGTSPAHANGAFPAPFRLFAPAARPDELVVTTNFGFVETTDGGRSWSWACEHGNGDSGYLYQQAPTPSRRIMAISIYGVAFTDDDACSWSAAAGQPADGVVTDYFVDPSDGQRVFLVIRRNVADVLTFSLVVSTNGGASLPSAALYAAPPGTSLDSFEVARTDANRMYLTLSSFVPDGTGPWVARSDDGGRSFAANDVSAATGAGVLRIAAVDPKDANHIFFRLEGAEDALLMSTDGGRTLMKLFTPGGGLMLSAFLQRQDGTLFLAAMDDTRGRLYRSTDGGKSFSVIADSLQSGSLVERAGTLYVLGNGITDPFLVGVSHDNGDTFQPFLKFADVKGVKACAADLRPLCAESCANLKDLGVLAPSVCQTLAEPSTTAADGGASDGDPGIDGSGDTPAPSPTDGAACSCSTVTTGPRGSRGAAPVVSLLAALILLRVRRRKNRRSVG